MTFPRKDDKKVRPLRIDKRMEVGEEGGEEKKGGKVASVGHLICEEDRGRVNDDQKDVQGGGRTTGWCGGSWMGRGTSCHGPWDETKRNETKRNDTKRKKRMVSAATDRITRR
ncbi:hypothetical protein M0802_014806 [Mischocyttarus mexicanus]|nr:hypothetical protein M0802_014833 [Mischocyttarus mexicanus]KAI4476905.1 hypothetical protein M0802_014806 [Mischocyttarus mexicanus]